MMDGLGSPVGEGRRDHLFASDVYPKISGAPHSHASRKPFFRLFSGLLLLNLKIPYRFSLKPEAYY